MLSVANWRRLAKFHSELISDALLSHAQAAETADVRLAWQVRSVLPILSQKAPDKALALVTELARIAPLSQFDLSMLARRRTNELAALMLGSDNVISGVFDTVADRLDDASLHALLKQNAINGYSITRLPFARREAAFDALYAPDAVVVPLYLNSLPVRRREQEARRHLALPQLAATPNHRLLYAAYLPWDELQAVLAPYLKTRMRSCAAQRCVCTLKPFGFNGSILAKCLISLHPKIGARPGTPANVIELVGDSCSRVSIGASWLAEHHYQSNARRQRSLVCHNKLRANFGVSSFAVFPEWAAQRLGEIVKTAGQLSSYPVADKLSAKDVAAVSPFLLPVFSSWVTRNEKELCFKP